MQRWARADLDEDQDRVAIESQAEKAGLGPFRVSMTANYLGIGDAVDVFRSRTLSDCEAVRSDYMDYYRARGFDIAAPGRRLTVVTLTDDRSFAGFLGKKEYAPARESRSGPIVHGLYQPRTNRLVVFDHRSLGRERVPFGGVEILRPGTRGNPSTDVQHGPARAGWRRPGLHLGRARHVRRAPEDQRPDPAG